MENNITTLILEAQGGNTVAFHKLVSYHDERVMTLALQLTRDKQDAEDLYQEVFMKAYKAIGSFRLESEFFTWLYRITVNSFYNLQRKASRIQQQESLVPEKDSTHDIADLDWSSDIETLLENPSLLNLNTSAIAYEQVVENNIIKSSTEVVWLDAKSG